MVNPLITGKEERIHCARMIHYCSAQDGANVPQTVLDLADRSESRYEVIDAILDIGQDCDKLYFKVCWDGLPHERDHT